MAKKVRFNRSAALRYAIYARMSSDAQNPRSPEQQATTIRETIQRERLPWTEAAVYSDSAITGRVVTKRPGLTLLMDNLKDGQLQIDVLVVDTSERLSRTEDAHALRRFFGKHGVVIVTAQSNLRDPTTSDGELVSFLDSWRGEQENAVKAHMIRRGKRDAVRQKFWPGGPPPVGYRLEPCGTEKRGTKVITHHRLVPDESTRILPERCFELADNQGWGAVRIAAELNIDPLIPATLKPIHANTVSRILANAIYLGRMILGKVTVGYVDDVRVTEKNPADELLIVDEFCEPLIAADLAARVHALQQQRQAAWQSQHAGDKPARKKRPGVAIKYALSGLVVCATCGRSMVAATRGQNPEERARHAMFRCPHVGSKICTNHSAVPVAWLFEHVMTLIIKRLFPSTAEGHEPISADTVAESPGFQEFLELVAEELHRLEEAQPTECSTLRAEQGQLRKQQQGMMQSLMNPDLHPDLRRQLEIDYSQRNQRLAEIDVCLRQWESSRQSFQSVCEPERVAQELLQISTCLRSDNAPAANLELARILDHITVDAEGRVRIRMCKLGFLVSPVLLTATSESSGTMTEQRMLAQRPSRIHDLDVNEELHGLFRPDTSIQPTRFDRFGPEWFWTDELTIPEKVCWSVSHAIEVAESRLAAPCSLEVLANRFGMSKPTIEVALKHAKAQGVDATMINGRSLKPNWARNQATEVAEYFKQPGATMAAAILHFGKSDAWIRKARKFAQEQAGKGSGELMVTSLKSAAVEDSAASHAKT